MLVASSSMFVPNAFSQLAVAVHWCPTADILVYGPDGQPRIYQDVKLVWDEEDQRCEFPAMDFLEDNEIEYHIQSIKCVPAAYKWNRIQCVRPFVPGP